MGVKSFLLERTVLLPSTNHKRAFVGADDEVRDAALLIRHPTIDTTLHYNRA
jgi:hypothetical protein